MNYNSSENPEDYIITREKLNDASRYAWFTKAYNYYAPDENKTKQLSKYREQINFVVFGASWCEDTHNLLPKFYKTVEIAGISEKDVKLFGVDREKKPVGNFKDNTLPNEDYNVRNVPTFIIYFDNREVGRIIETVQKSIEKDIIDIIEKAGLNQ